MANAKLFHDRRGIKDADTPSMLRMMIRHKNTTASIPMDIRLTENQWDGTQVINHPGARQMNIVLSKKSADIDAAMMILTMDGDVYKNATALKDAILKKLYPDQFKNKDGLEEDGRHLFIPYYTAFMEERKAKGTAVIYERALKWIKKYDKKIEGKVIEDLDRNWLKGLEKAMEASCCKNTRSILLRSVRSVFSRAKEDGIITADPFSGYDLREEPTIKRSMSIETLQTIRDWEVSPWQEEYRDMFMLMFYLIGINAGDLFLAKKEQLADGRLEYTRKKTGKHYSILVPPEAMAIIEKYKGKNYLLSPMDRYGNYKDYLQHMNYALTTLGQVYSTSSRKEGEAIFPKLSTYWARHTWATLAYEIGIPIDTIGQALGHSDRAHTITFVYIRLDNKKVDDANRKVLDFLAA